MVIQGRDIDSGARGEVVVALLTPYRSDGTVDLAATRAHVEMLAAAGVDGVMPAGTTGEGPLLDDDEVVALTASAVEAAAGAVKVIAHVGRVSTRATIALARRAIDAGAAALSAVVPYYYALSESRQTEHFLSLIEALGSAVPLYAYTIPARTGNELSVATLIELRGAGLAGLKDSSKSFDRHCEYLATGLPILMGSDEFVRDALEAGAVGCVSAIANVRPELLLDIAGAVASGDDDSAAAHQRELSVLRAELQREPALVGLKRLLAARMSNYPDAVRPPLG